MLIFWQECKHILRSRFWLVVAVLGMVFCIYGGFRNCYSYGGEDLSLSYQFTQEHGTSFTEEDAVAYVKYYLEKSEEGKEIQKDVKEAGLDTITAEEVSAYYNEEPTRFDEKLREMREGKTSEEENAYWNVLHYMSILYGTMEIPKANSLDPEFYDMKEWGKNMLEQTSFPKWKEELLLDGYAHLDERVEEIKKNGENHQMLPVEMSVSDNSQWFRFQFTTNGPLGILWGLSFVLAGIAAARSFGGSFMNNLQGMVYTGKTGRRLVWRKLLAVLTISAGAYIVLYLLMTVFCIFLFRLDLYWNVPLASMVYYGNSTIPRFAITIGGYWWFQLGVGLGAILIMALIFSASMVFTKSFYAGSAIAVGVSLLLLGLIEIVPGMQNSMLFMGSPIGLFLQAGCFFQERLFQFSMLSHFEGIMLLIWGSFAAILAALGFVRFRRAAL